MDGHYARKYKMTSKFGDLYDHIKDYTILALMLIIIFMRYNGGYYEYIIIGMIFFNLRNLSAIR